MKKVIVFLLVIALAIGGIGAAHAAVTASQDDLVLYPTIQVGDPAVLEGLTAGLTFACGDHLIWKTDYPSAARPSQNLSTTANPSSPPRPTATTPWMCGSTAV